MKQIIYSIILVVYLISIASSLFALEIDEKLTLRILKVSETKKTILINRGIEDGLNVGDHAKFFLTTGVIARGMVVKVSPARSVWSIYRLVNPEYMTIDRVLNLKISTPVKVTDDPSKALNANHNDEDIDPSTPETISLPVDEVSAATSNEHEVKVSVSKGARRVSKDVEQQELDALEGKNTLEDAPMVGSSINSRNYTFYGQRPWEVVGGLYLQSLGVSNVGRSSSSGTLSNINFLVEIEKYFSSRASWYYDLSLVGLVNYQNLQLINVDGHKLNTGVVDVGIGTNWHIFEPQHTTNKAIWFALLNFGLSFTTDGSSLNVATTSVPDTNFRGGGSFIALGAGLKYNLNSGWGFRLFADLYRRAEIYAMSDGKETTKTLFGPRIYYAISYRF